MLDGRREVGHVTVYLVCISVCMFAAFRVFMYVFRPAVAGLSDHVKITPKKSSFPRFRGGSCDFRPISTETFSPAVLFGDLGQARSSRRVCLTMKAFEHRNTGVHGKTWQGGLDPGSAAAA